MSGLLNGSFKIAVQKKGRLTEASLKLLKDIGLDFEIYKRQLYAKCKNMDVSILFVRNKDIPLMLQKGTVDSAIIGGDLINEYELNTAEGISLGFGRCKLELMAKKDSGIKDITNLNSTTIATSFPQITRQYLESKNIDAEIIELNGGVELSPSLELADAVVDLVSSGFTKKMNDLMTLDIVLDIQSKFINRDKLTKGKKEIFDKLVFRIEAVKRAENYKYIMMNLPEERLEKIRELLPGLKSPTIANLSEDGWISVQTVLEEGQFWESIDKLKEFGAEGIIVLPLEKLIR